jgi:cytochrome c oxidase assembly factor CtaG
LIPPGSILTAWDWRPDVVLVLGAAGLLYVTGWRRLRVRGSAVAPAWRLGLYLGGLAAAALSLLSPLSVYSTVLFSAHMIQHQVLTMIAAPLLLLGDPLPVMLWGLPAPVRRPVGGVLRPVGAGRRALRALTWMPVAGGLHVATLWVWHVPASYQASLADPWLHDAQHLSFFLTGLLFWWPIVNPAPRLHPLRSGLGYALRIGYLILATAQNTLLGALIALSGRLLYPAYAAAPRLFGLGPMDDQSLAGGIMWSGSHMYLIAVLVLVHHALGGRESAEPGNGDSRPPAAGLLAASGDRAAGDS